MSEALYTPCVSNVLSGEEFLSSVIVDEPCGATPAFSRTPKGEWACDNPACTAGEVVVSFSLWCEEGCRPSVPPLTCPACQAPLRFVEFVRERKLLLVPPGRSE